MPTEKPNGSDPSNSRKESESVTLSPLFRVQQVGIDTVSFAWRFPAEHPVWDWIRRCGEDGLLPNQDTETTYGWVESAGLEPARLPGCKPGEGWKTTNPVWGVGWFFDLHHGLVFCEGRLACLLADDPEAPRRLCSFAELQDGVGLAARVMQELGVGLTATRARIRRLDLAGDVLFADERLGTSLQRVLLEQAAGTKQPSYNGPNLGTVAWHRGGEVELRSYDRGALTGEYPAGRLIRLERQWRPEWHARDPKSQPLALDLLDTNNPSELWLGRFGITISGITAPLLTSRDARLVIHERLQEGRLARETAVRHLGTIDLLELGGYAAWGADATGRRVRNQAVAELRKLGIEVISPHHERGTPWPTHADCRPAGLIVRIADLVAALRAAMDMLAAGTPAEASALALRRAEQNAAAEALLASFGCVEELVAA